MRGNKSFWIGIGLLAAFSGTALAQSSSTASNTNSTDAAGLLPQLVVIGTTPLPGTSIDIDKVPGNVQTLGSAELSKDGSASIFECARDAACERRSTPEILNALR